MLLSKKLYGISTLLVCSIVQGFSQEQLGLRLSNYSGINATMFNPAFNVNAPLKWDINIIAAGAFEENNYVFIRDANLFRVIRNRSGFSLSGSASNDETSFSSDGLQYDFTSSNRKKEAFNNIFLTGPSAMFHVKKHTFGVFFNIRSITSANRVPSVLGYYDLNGMETGEILHVKPFKIAGMTWSEIGLNYGKNILKKGRHTLDGGVTLKLLQGYEAFYFQNREPTNITINVDSMTYESGHVAYGISNGITGYGSGITRYDLKARGYGASGDIGVIYSIQSSNNKRAYDWKFGLSLLDFGKIAFSKGAQAHEINTNAPFDFVQEDYSGFEEFNEIFSLLSSQSLDNPDASLINDRFSIWTPAGISIFAEKAITNHFYVNATVVRRLRFKGAVPERDNIWAITPRYEHRWFEVSIPLVLYNDKDFRLGSSVRLGPLVIGSDNLTSWFGSHDFSGSDVYFAFKLNPFSLKKAKDSRSRKASVDPKDCFEFY